MGLRPIGGWVPFFNGATKSGCGIEFYNFETKRATKTWFLPKDTNFLPAGPILAVSPDGKWILYVKNEPSHGNIMLVENLNLSPD